MLDPDQPFDDPRPLADLSRTVTVAQQPHMVAGNDPDPSRDEALQAFRDTLASIRHEYRAALPGHLARAREALGRCLAAPGDAGLLREFQRLIHTLAGTAGTFGETEVGACAEGIEQLLEGLVSRTDRTPADFEPVALLMDRWGPRASLIPHAGCLQQPTETLPRSPA